jgi:ubiquinone/menaquinone biosynthesis C-methylase UbiE
VAAMTDFAEVKRRAAVAWSAGAFEEVADSIGDVHAALVEALGPQPGERWLDVACGAGHVAELASGAGARVTGIDISPRLIEVARSRAAAGGYDIDYRVGDAESLDVGGESFEVVSSSFGLIFAPDHDAVARELARVLGTGGRLAFSAWTPQGSMGDMLRMLGRFQPPPPPGAGAPLAWGDEQHVRDELADAFDLTYDLRNSRAEEESFDEFWPQFSTNFGPLKLLLENLDPERRSELETAARDHYGRFEQPDGSLVDEREYLLVTGIRR